MADIVKYSSRTVNNGIDQIKISEASKLGALIVESTILSAILKLAQIAFSRGLAAGGVTPGHNSRSTAWNDGSFNLAVFACSPGSFLPTGRQTGPPHKGRVKSTCLRAHIPENSIRFLLARIASKSLELRRFEDTRLFPLHLLEIFVPPWSLFGSIRSVSLREIDIYDYCSQLYLTV